MSQARIEGSFCIHEIPIWCLHKKRMNGNRSQAQRRITIAKPENSITGTRTWWRLSLSLWQSSWGAGVHQSISVPARRITSSKAGRRRELNCSCLTPRQQHRKDQDFEVTTEPRSTIKSGRPWWAVSDYKVYKDLCKPGCINHLHRFIVYHFRKSSDNDENRIVIYVLPVGRHRQFRPSCFSNR